MKTEVWKFCRSGSFLQKRKKMSKIFNVLRLQAAITPQWLQVARNYYQTDPLRDVCFPFLPLESIQSLSPGMYVPYKNGTYPNFRQRPMSNIAY